MSDINLLTKDLPTRWQVREPPPPVIGKYYGDLTHSIWQLMIEEILRDPQYSVSRLAEEVGVSRTTILNLRNKADYSPHIATVSRVLSVYCQVMQERDEGK